MDLMNTDLSQLIESERLVKEIKEKYQREYTKQIEFIRRDLNFSKQQINDSLKECNELKSAKNNLELENKNLKNTITELEEKIKNIESNLSAKENQISSHINQIEQKEINWSKENTQIISTNKDLMKKLLDWNKVVKIIAAKLQASQNKFQSNLVDSIELQVKNEELNKQISMIEFEKETECINFAETQNSLKIISERNQIYESNLLQVFQILDDLRNSAMNISSIDEKSLNNYKLENFRLKNELKNYKEKLNNELLNSSTSSNQDVRENNVKIFTQNLKDTMHDAKEFISKLFEKTEQELKNNSSKQIIPENKNDYKEELKAIRLKLSNSEKKALKHEEDANQLKFKLMSIEERNSGLENQLEIQKNDNFILQKKIKELEKQTYDQAASYQINEPKTMKKNNYHKKIIEKPTTTVCNDCGLKINQKLKNVKCNICDHLYHKKCSGVRGKKAIAEFVCSDCE